MRGLNSKEKERTEINIVNEPNRENIIMNVLCSSNLVREDTSIPSHGVDLIIIQWANYIMHCQDWKTKSSRK